MNAIEYAKLQIQCDKCSAKRVYVDYQTEPIHLNDCLHCDIAKQIEEYEYDDRSRCKKNAEDDEE